MSDKDTNGGSTWTLFVCLLSSCLLRLSTCADVQVKGRSGGDVLLPCQGTKEITFLQWNKPDVKSDYFVYFYRNKQLDRNFQHESFRDRVELKESNMKIGDASVILKNVTVNDTGSYECHVAYGGSLELISRVDLTVSPPGAGAAHTEDGGDKDVEESIEDKNGADNARHVGLAVGLSVAAVVLVAVVAFLIYKKNQTERNSY